MDSASGAIGFGLWQTKRRGGGYAAQWEDCPPHIACQLEIANTVRRESVTFTLSSNIAALRQDDAGELQYKVDLEQMTQTCVQHPGRIRDVRRVDCQDCRLTLSQQAAIKHASDRCHRDVQKHHRSLLSKIGDSLFQELDRFMKFEVPLLIHTKLTGKTIDYYLNDTNYRNFFETHTGRGATCEDSRRSWEANHFGQAFKGAKDHERPKYGCLNLTNDPRGVKGATQYGTSFFVLKDSVRWRCTFTQKDSSRHVGNEPGTAIQYSKFLDNSTVFSSDDLERIADHRGGQLGGYKEIQIHGPVRFNKDIAMIVASDEIPEVSTLKVAEFARKNDIELVWRSTFPTREASWGPSGESPL